MLRRALLAALAAAALAAPASSAAPPREPLDLVSYPGFVEDGSTHPSLDWVHPFERATGCDVRNRTVRSATELLEVVGRGGYDAVATYTDVSLVLVGGKEVQPVDVGRVARYRALAPQLRAAGRFGGDVWGVPQLRIEHGLLVRSDLVHGGADVWSPAGRLAGRVADEDTPMVFADAALRLGFRNPYELDRRQFEAAVRLAGRQRAAVGTYWQNDLDVLADFTGGAAVAGIAPPRIASLLRADSVPVRWQAPAGRHTGRIALWMPLAGAQHLDCFYRWLDWTLSPAVSRQIARRLGGVAADRPVDWRNVLPWQTPRQNCGDSRGSVCVDWFDWSDAWAALRSD